MRSVVSQGGRDLNPRRPPRPVPSSREHPVAWLGVRECHSSHSLTIRSVPRHRRPGRTRVQAAPQDSAQRRVSRRGTFRSYSVRLAYGYAQCRTSLFFVVGAPAPGMLHLRPSWTILVVIAVRRLLSTFVCGRARTARRVRLEENLDFTHINVNNLAGLFIAPKPGVTRQPRQVRTTEMLCRYGSVITSVAGAMPYGRQDR
jgi:hypothetical protein